MSSAKLNRNMYLTGTNGTIWINGKLYANISKIEAKVSGNFEEVKTCGFFGVQQVYTGWSGEGTMTFRKIDSEIISTMGKTFETGELPDIKIVTKLENKSTGKAERVALLQVDFKEFSLINFESHGLIEEEVPFSFGDYEILETISY